MPNVSHSIVKQYTKGESLTMTDSRQGIAPQTVHNLIKDWVYFNRISFFVWTKHPARYTRCTPLHRLAPPPAFGVRAGRLFNTIHKCCDFTFDDLELTSSVPLSCEERGKARLRRGRGRVRCQRSNTNFFTSTKLPALN